MRPGAPAQCGGISPVCGTNRDHWLRRSRRSRLGNTGSSAAANSGAGIRRLHDRPLAATGHLHRLHRGVYSVGHTLVSQEGRWLAAVLACGPGAFLSHGPAGQLQGIVPAVSGSRCTFRSSRAPTGGPRASSRTAPVRLIPATRRPACGSRPPPRPERSGIWRRPSPRCRPVVPSSRPRSCIC